MTSRMEYEPDSPLSYDVEEGKLSSGRSSSGTIRENASECSTENGHCDTVKTMTVEVDNHQTPPSNHQTPQKTARRVAEHIVRPKTSDERKKLESFRTRKQMVNQANQVDKTDIERPDNNTKSSYQHNRRVKNLAHQQHNNKKWSTRHQKKYASPPMTMHPPPVRPPPPLEDITMKRHRMQQQAQQRCFERTT